MKIGLNIGHYGTKGAMGILDEERCNTAADKALEEIRWQAITSNAVQSAGQK